MDGDSGVNPCKILLKATLRLFFFRLYIKGFNKGAMMMYMRAMTLSWFIEYFNLYT